MNLRKHLSPHHRGTFPKTGTSGSDNIGTCYDFSSESCRNAHSAHIPVSSAQYAGKSPAQSKAHLVKQLTQNFPLNNLLWVKEKMFYLASFTGMYAVVEARGLVPADLTLHTDPGACAVLLAQTQLF